MRPAIRATSVWLTTAMLLAQAVCPGLLFACGCNRSGRLSCFANRGGVSVHTCCTSAESDSSPACLHCGVGSHADRSASGQAVCHCGDYAPSQLALPGVPGSQHLTSLFDWIGAGTTCSTTALALPAPPVHAQVPSSQFLVPHFKQILHCVWLT